MQSFNFKYFNTLAIWFWVNLLCQFWQNFGQLWAEDTTIFHREALQLDNIYLFRGIRLYDGASLDTSIDGGYNFGRKIGQAGVHFDWRAPLAGDQEDSPAFQQFDYEPFYEFSFGSLALHAGHTFRHYSSDVFDLDDTREFNFSIDMDAVLNPRFLIVYDYAELDYQYFEVGLKESFPSHTFDDKVSLAPFITFAYATNSTKVYTSDGLNHMILGSALDFEVGPILISPTLAYVFESDRAVDNQWWCGVRVTLLRNNQPG